MSSEFITQREACALINAAQEQTPAEARHDAGQAVMGNKKLALLMALAVQVDERGLDAAVNCLTFHLRYPK